MADIALLGLHRFGPDAGGGDIEVDLVGRRVHRHHLRLAGMGEVEAHGDRLFVLGDGHRLDDGQRRFVAGGRGGESESMEDGESAQRQGGAVGRAAGLPRG